jgi:SAM-dependent methyltransferase
MEFDQYAQSYRAIVDQAAGVSVEKLAGEKARLILKLLAGCAREPNRLRVLDVGCGTGLVDHDLERQVAELWGVDTSLRSLELARGCAPATRFVHYDGAHLPLADDSFDAVLASCVLHHVPPAARPAFMAEMLRPLRSTGIVVLIEHNPLNPVTRRIVSRCPFDADAVLLGCREAARLVATAGATVVGRRYIGFSPLRGALIEQAECAIGWLPMGAQYCVWGTKNSRPCGN